MPREGFGSEGWKLLGKEETQSAFGGLVEIDLFPPNQFSSFQLVFLQEVRVERYLADDEGASITSARRFSVWLLNSVRV